MVVESVTDERQSGRSAGSPVDKGTLFCGECLHRSRFDGQWTIVETEDRLRYLCPNCRSEIMSRGVPDGTGTTDETYVSVDVN